MITAGVRFHDAGIDREGFTLNQTGSNASNTWRNKSLSRNRP